MNSKTLHGMSLRQGVDRRPSFSHAITAGSSHWRRGCWSHARPVDSGRHARHGMGDVDSIGQYRQIHTKTYGAAGFHDSPHKRGCVALCNGVRTKETKSTNDPKHAPLGIPICWSYDVYSCEVLSMSRANVVLDDALVAKCLRSTGIKTRRTRINHALEELLTTDH